jgi:TetR/AcrR family transcriptional repressor of bet genes
MGRKPNTEQRRAQIADALLAVMAEKGYEGASIQAIARQAGLAPGLVHYHFKSKQQILLAAVERLVAAAGARFEASASKAKSPDDKLRALVHARLALGEGEDRRAVAAWVMIGAEAVRQLEVREVYQAVMADQMALIAGLLADCGVRPKKVARDKAATLLAMMEGMYQLSSAAGAAVPEGYAEKAALEYLAAVIG